MLLWTFEGDTQRAIRLIRAWPIYRFASATLPSNKMQAQEEPLKATVLLGGLYGLRQPESLRFLNIELTRFIGMCSSWQMIRVNKVRTL